MFALIANVGKSTNDLNFMNRFHIRVLIMFDFILMLEQELKESIYFNTS